MADLNNLATILGGVDLLEVGMCQMHGCDNELQTLNGNEVAYIIGVLGKDENT